MKKNKLIQTLIFITILLGSINFVYSQSDYIIEGIVSYKNSDPGKNVKVELLDGDSVIKSDKTNKQGYYLIKSQLRDNSEYILRITHDSTQQQLIEFTSTQSRIELDITLNRYPTARIDGPESGSINEQIAFSSSRSYDPDNDPLAFYWDFGNGETSREENPITRYNQPGDYDVTLSIQDIDGAKSVDHITIKIQNEPPIANSNGPYSTTIGKTVAFSSDGSYDPEQEKLGYLWDFGDDTHSDEANPQHIYYEKGDYEVTLIVSDPHGAIDKSETKCQVQEVIGLQADANGPYTGQVGFPVEFSSEGSSDPYGKITEYYWVFGDGQESNSISPVITFQEAGDYTVSLTITNEEGQSDTDTTTCKISTLPPLPPIAECNGPYKGQLGRSIAFKSIGSYDPNGTPITYLWTFGTGDTSTEANPRYAYEEIGVYTITLTVTDLDGEIDTATTTCIIENAPPPQPAPPLLPSNEKPVALIDCSSSGEVGEIIKFSSSRSFDIDGEIVSISWSFGDNHASHEENTTYVYNASGIYTITLTVQDNVGKTDTVSKEITISDPNTPPVSIIDGPYEGKIGSLLQYNSSRSYDLDGNITDFLWSFDDNSTSNLQNPLHNYSLPGLYIITFTVTDDDGAINYTQISTLILENNSPVPQILAPENAKTGEVVEFSALESYDTDGMIIDYRWDFGDETISTLAQNSHIFIEEGVYNISLTVTDDNLDKNEVFSKIEILKNIPPKIEVNNTILGIPFQKISFRSKSYDVDGQIVSTLWDFGDEKIAEGTEVSHIYNKTGLYYGKIVVSDNNFDTSIEIIEIQITEPNNNLNLPYTTITASVMILAFLLRKSIHATLKRSLSWFGARITLFKSVTLIRP